MVVVAYPVRGCLIAEMKRSGTAARSIFLGLCRWSDKFGGGKVVPHEFVLLRWWSLVVVDLD